MHGRAEPRAVGILDWESARPEGLPLSDLAYATVDAVHTAQRMARADAFSACFGHDGELREAVRALFGRLPPEIAPGPELAAAALHTSALMHAVNERRAGAAGQRPFLEVVRRAAVLEVP